MKDKSKRDLMSISRRGALSFITKHMGDSRSLRHSFMEQREELIPLCVFVISSLIVAFILLNAIHNLQVRQSAFPQYNESSKAKTERIYFNIGIATKSIFYHELKAKR